MGWFAGFEIQVRISAIAATGMLTQKIARQSISVRKPPASGPIAVRPPATAKKTHRLAALADRKRGDDDRKSGREH